MGGGDRRVGTRHANQRRRHRFLRAVVAFALGAGTLAAATVPDATPAAAATLPADFSEAVVFSGLTNPTVVRFAPDGRVFVAEKRGLIKVFDCIDGHHADRLRRSQRERLQLLGSRAARHGARPAVPDPALRLRPLHLRPPTRFGRAGAALGDRRRVFRPVPDAPGADRRRLRRSGRLSRLQADGNVMTGTEQVLVEDWCQQYPSHSIGHDRVRCRRRALRQRRRRRELQLRRLGPGRQSAQPCGDPPGGVGATLTPPTAEGGALRSQDLPHGAAIRSSLDGSDHPRRPEHRRRHSRTIRCPAAPIPTPAGSSPTACATPSASRSGLAPTKSGSATSAGATGRRSTGSSIPIDGVKNFGWPCYEGHGRQAGYDAANLNICENLYGQAGAVTAPYHAYRHSGQGRPGRKLPDRQFVDRRSDIRVQQRRLPIPRRTTARCSSPTTRATASG